MEQLGAKLRELRKLNGFSLKQLAERAECSSSYLSMIENGKIDPGISRLKKIADGLEITLVDLFQNEPDSKIVIRKHERVRGTFRGSKTKIEILVPRTSDRKMDARLAIIAPGGSSEGNYRHPGEEFGPEAWTFRLVEPPIISRRMTAFTSLQRRITVLSTRVRRIPSWCGSTILQAGKKLKGCMASFPRTEPCDPSAYRISERMSFF